MFVLILLNNLFGVIPPFQFPTMSRIGFPIALTLIVYVVYHTVGIRRIGPRRLLQAHDPARRAGLGARHARPARVLTYFFIRPVTLALRLFGNMFAGHLLLVLFITGGEYLVLHSAARPTARSGSSPASWPSS